jgi:hypothetical protein
MKKLICIIIIGVFAMQAFGQDTGNEDQKEAQTDSLNMKIKSLTLQLDSVTGELTRYTGMYGVLYEKVFHYRFLPEKTAFLIDSLRSSRDSLTVLPVGINSMASDSVLLLLKENKALTAKIDSVKLAGDKEKNLIPAEDVQRTRVVNDLKQLKELLDNKIITDAEFLELKKKYILKL